MEAVDKIVNKLSKNLEKGLDTTPQKARRLGGYNNSTDPKLPDTKLIIHPRWWGEGETSVASSLRIAADT